MKWKHKEEIIHRFFKYKLNNNLFENNFSLFKEDNVFILFRIGLIFFYYSRLTIINSKTHYNSINDILVKYLGPYTATRRTTLSITSIDINYVFKSDSLDSMVPQLYFVSIFTGFRPSDQCFYYNVEKPYE